MAMSPLAMAMMLAEATTGDMNGAIEIMDPDAPKTPRHPRIGDPGIPEDYYAREIQKRAKPLSPAQVAATAKTARKNLIRLVYGTASGEQIMTAWHELLRWDPAFDVARLPAAVANAVVAFMTCEDSVFRPIVHRPG